MSYIPAVYDSTITQVSPDALSTATAWSVTFTFTQSGSPIPWTGYTGEFVISAPVNLTLTSVSGAVVLGASDGTVSVALTVAQVNAQSPVAKPTYYLQLTDSFGNPSIPVKGTLYWSAA